MRRHDADYDGRSHERLRSRLHADHPRPITRRQFLGQGFLAGAAFVSLFDPKTQDDLIKNLILEGLLMVDKKGGRRMAKMVSGYLDAMDKAKKNHLNIWEYGDITVDDAKEFGLGR